MKFRINVLSLLILIVTIVDSCSKTKNNGSGGNEILEADVDGNHVVFTKQVSASNAFEPNYNKYGLLIIGYQGAVENSDWITLNILTNHPPVVTGVYSD